MIVKDFLTVWHLLDLYELNIKYYFKGTQCTLFQLRTKYMLEPIKHLRLVPTNEILTSDSIVLDLSQCGELSYSDEKLIEHINYIIPSGTYGIVLNLYIE